jgi:sulfite exporter TauE/SafE
MDLAAAQGAAPLAALAAGLLGGVHCVGMCGGIAGALAGAAKGPIPLRLAAFNAGRIASYGVAGALAGALGGLAAILVPLHDARVALFIVAQLMLILLGLYIAGWTAFFPRLEAAGGAVWAKTAPLRRRFVPIDTTPKALAAGALWGWVPCGMIYGMLPFALASGAPASGALILVAFGVGTLPSLLVAGTAGARFREWRRHAWVRRSAGALVILVALFGLSHLPAAADLLTYAWLCLRPAG